MANITKQKRDQMIAFLEELKKEHSDDASVRAFNEIENHLLEKKFGLVFEEHNEFVDDMLKDNIPVFETDSERRICKDANLHWNFIIEGDNLQALILLEKTHKGKISCIYIDPPYNTGARDWKYNNDYIDSNDVYRHSKWLSMMKSRLEIAKRLLDPKDSVLICAIDENEYLHLGCLLEELFPTATIQMISTIINRKGVSPRHAIKKTFARGTEYLFFVMIGDACVNELQLPLEWLPNGTETTRDKLRLADMMRHGKDGRRVARPNLFYPVFVSNDGKKFMGVGDTLPIDKKRTDIDVPQNAIAIWPVHSDGTEGCWSYSQEGMIELQKKGYLRLGKLQGDKMSLSFIQPGWQKRIENGDVLVKGYDETGFIQIDAQNYSPRFIPMDSWNISSHNASENGMKLLQKYIGSRFSFPKSLYAVHDAIKFFVANKPDAIILDFFAGSGTTMHAVNLLNAEDGGNRRCIMVTNNEISEEEAKRLSSEGFQKGDNEWEELGIAKYVTWPRTAGSINGVDLDGKPVDGTYLNSDIKLSDGFMCNVKYFKCNWTQRKPEDYLLSNALCLHIKEMIELQNAIEVDGEKNVLLLNRDDIRNVILNPNNYDRVESIWLNQSIILKPNELKLLNQKGFKYIPREFFGQELREVAE